MCQYANVPIGCAMSWIIYQYACCVYSKKHSAAIGTLAHWHIGILTHYLRCRIFPFSVSAAIAVVVAFCVGRYDFETDVIVSATRVGCGVIHETQRIVYLEAEIDTFDILHCAILFHLHTGTGQ